MDQAISIAIQRKKKYVWLGVWEKTKRRSAFTDGMAFTRSGHLPVMCDDEQTDYIMQRCGFRG